MSIPFSTNVVMLNAVTADTTSEAYDVSKRQQITIQLLCSGHTSGSGAFSFDVSNDGSNWITGIAFQDAVATASTTWVTSKTLNANGSAGVYIKGGWRYIRAVVDQTTDGAYSAIMQNGG